MAEKELISSVWNEDNMIGMARYPDKFFDLAIVDPPYGIGMGKGIEVGKLKRNIHTSKDWDKCTPNKDYWVELFRVSKNQIIWGGNYFIEHLKNTRCIIFWDKKNGGNFMSDGEIAWTSFSSSIRRFGYNHIEEYNIGIDRIHPTQKPIKLYRWLLKNYAKPGDKILDTHMGSQSSRIAAWDMGFNYWGWELDKEYFDAGCKRFEDFRKQIKLF
jgi:site-specific DNA-methyltransferase (adenine-specific)